MASKRVFSEEDFACPVCFDIFKDPLLLPCGHSVCKVCVRQYWTTKGSRECPICRKRSVKNPPVNLALRNLSQTFLEVREDPETLCDIHGEKLKLYCVDDAQLVCVVCRESETHQCHRFRPVDEIAVELKDVLQSALKTVVVKQKHLQEAQFKCHQKIAHIKQQAQHIKNQTKEEIKKLVRFLICELKTVMTALGQEELEKTQRLKEKIEKMNQEIQSLSRTVTDIGKELQSDSFKFVKNFEKNLEKVQCMQTGTEVASGEVISVSKYLGNLQFRVWRKMQRIIKCTPVVLDPNTAHNQLVISSDLRSVRDADDHEDENNMKSQQGLNIPEQFERCLCVLGSVGFSSGKHTWDVEVGNNTFWMIGVTTESVDRKEHSVFPSRAWGIGYDNQQLCARSPSEAYTHLPVTDKPQVVRVHLDMNAGEVRFSDPLSGTVIHRFTHNFTEKVFPFFQSLCSVCPLKILPLQPWVVLIKQ